MTTTPSAAALELLDLHIAARDLVDEVRLAWGWLRLLLEPGPETSTGRVVDDAQAERLTAQGYADRAYRDWNLKHGRGALAPSRSPLRIAVADACVAVHGQVLHAALRLALGLGRPYQARRGDAGAQVAAALAWMAGDEPTGGPWVAGTDGVWWRRGPLDELRDLATARDVVGALRRALRTARTAAGIHGERVQPVGHRCPACRARSLQLHYDGADRRRWYVRCVSERCRCTGVGCPCRQRTRYSGRAHAWAYGELDQLWAAIAAQPPGKRVESGGQGRGWR